MKIRLSLHTYMFSQSWRENVFSSIPLTQSARVRKITLFSLHHKLYLFCQITKSRTYLERLNWQFFSGFGKVPYYSWKGHELNAFLVSRSISDAHSAQKKDFPKLSPLESMPKLKVRIFPSYRLWAMLMTNAFKFSLSIEN